MTRLERSKNIVEKKLIHFNLEEMEKVFQLIINQLPTFQEKEAFISFYEEKTSKKII